jgi:mannitol/fructose-specific phosphotransferase system IIA component (Ntr-type)
VGPPCGTLPPAAQVTPLMSLIALIDESVGIESLASTDAGGVFLEVARALVGSRSAPGLDAEALSSAFLARERQGSTALGFGVALPHIFAPEVQSVRLVIARHPVGVDMRAMDGQPTRVLFCLAGPVAGRDAHLKLLRFLAQTLRDRDWRRFILSAPSTAAIADILREASAGVGG